MIGFSGMFSWRDFKNGSFCPQIFVKDRIKLADGPPGNKSHVCFLALRCSSYQISNNNNVVPQCVIQCVSLYERTLYNTYWGKQTGKSLRKSWIDLQGNLDWCKRCFDRIFFSKIPSYSLIFSGFDDESYRRRPYLYGTF